MKCFRSLFRDIAPFNVASTSMECWYLDAALALQEHLLNPEQFTWESAAQYLRSRSLVREEQSEEVTLSQYFVFCLIGAMTCLYHASSPGSSEDYDWRDFKIQSVCASTSHRFWCYFGSVSTGLSFHGPVSTFLAGFGDVLPLTDGEGRSAVSEEALLDPNQFNANVMQRTLKMKIIWTDTLGAHLDFDSESNTIFLFRQASLCFLNAGDLDRGFAILQR